MAVATATSLVTSGCTGDDANGDAGEASSDDGTAATTSTGLDSGDETAASVDASETGVPTGCEVVPDAWSAPDWDANAAAALALRAQLDMLTGDALMRGAELGDVALADSTDLIAAWDGEPSLAMVANPSFVATAEQVFDQFVAVIAAGPQDLTNERGAWMPGPDGGIWGDDARGIDEGGIELRQVIDKGGFAGGVHFAYAVSLTEGAIEPATIDAIAAAWGSNATLDPEMMPADSAGYAYQMGFHAVMVDALTDAKAYAGDAACEVERDAALIEFFNLWEQSMLARLVFYGNRAEGKLLVATTDTELADVLHDLGEGLGLAIGFYGLPDAQAGPLVGATRIAGDAELEAIFTAFGVDIADLGASTVGGFVESLPELEEAVTATEGVVMSAYGVDIATIQQYAMPTPG